MKIKGLDNVRRRLPDHPGHRLLVFPATALSCGVLALLLMFWLETAARVSTGVQVLATLEPLMPVVGPLVVEAIGLLLVVSALTGRERLVREYGRRRAYPRALMRGATGVALMMSVLANGLLPVSALPPGPPVNGLTTLFSTSFLVLLGAPAWEVYLRAVAGGIHILLAVLTAWAGFRTIGIDYVVVLYVYYPEDAEVQQHRIYSVLRHPIYYTVKLFARGIFLLYLSVYGLATCAIAYVGIRLLIRAEERELLERFGDDYRAYMERVPQFSVPLRRLKDYLLFITGRGDRARGDSTDSGATTGDTPGHDRGTDAPARGQADT